MSRRGYVRLIDKLAACVRELFQIPYEHAKQMSAEQILSLVQWQHIHYHAQNSDETWVDAHWNIEPMLIAPHKEVTAKKDIPQIAKTKRIEREFEEFRRRMMTPREDRPVLKSRWGTRKFPTKRKVK